MINWLLSLSNLQLAVFVLVVILLTGIMLLAANDPRRYK